jgi:hypothetical protein
MRAFRGVAVGLMVAGLALGACGGDDADRGGGVTVDDPIGGPETGVSYDTPADPAISKSASIDVEVPRSELGESAQAVVDLATSPKVGGFLVSSVLDLEDGYGSGAILVEVPSDEFEASVVELSGIGELRRQEMSGADLTYDLAAATTKEAKARVRADAAYSQIDVALAGKRPPPAPEKPPVERALATAKTISLVIASGAIVAGGVGLPVGVAALILYLVATRIARRLRVRLEG